MTINCRDIGLVISSKIAYHTALPYINELHRRNIKIEYLVSDDVFQDITTNKEENEVVYQINYYKSTNKLALIIHRILLLIYTPEDFSPLYKRWLKQRFSNSFFSLFYFIEAFNKVFRKIKKNNINQRLVKKTSGFIKQSLNVDKIINITIPIVPFLLADNSKRIYSILESWDHPGKSPMGYTSKKVFLWNNSMKEEWLKYQEDKNIHFSYPIKLAYAINKNVNTRKNINKNVVMYPFTTSSGSDINLYKEEVDFIHIVCGVLNKLNYKLYIKPKPNTPIGELDFFKQYKNVNIGSYQKNNGGSSYGLGKDYNENRLKELSQCSYVITRGTTFSFDAAAYGLPVVHFMFSTPSIFPALSNLKNYPHISKHIISNKELVFELISSETIEKQLVSIFNNPNTIKKAEKFRDYLRDWLIPDETMEESVSKVVDEILKDD